MAPDSVSTPVPIFSIPVVPVITPSKTPERMKVVFVLVSVPLPRRLLTAKLGVGALPARSSVAPAAMVVEARRSVSSASEPLPLITVPPSMRKAPTATAVVTVLKLVVMVPVSVALPRLRPELALRTKSPVSVAVRPAAAVMSPLFPVSTLMLLAMVPFTSRRSAPPLSAISPVPAPRAPTLPSATVPPRMMVVPV